MLAPSCHPVPCLARRNCQLGFPNNGPNRGAAMLDWSLRDAQKPKYKSTHLESGHSSPTVQIYRIPLVIEDKHFAWSLLHEQADRNRPSKSSITPVPYQEYFAGGDWRSDRTALAPDGRHMGKTCLIISRKPVAIVQKGCRQFHVGLAEVLHAKRALYLRDTLLQLP